MSSIVDALMGLHGAAGGQLAQVMQPLAALHGVLAQHPQGTEMLQHLSTLHGAMAQHPDPSGMAARMASLPAALTPAGYGAQQQALNAGVHATASQTPLATLNTGPSTSGKIGGLLNFAAQMSQQQQQPPPMQPLQGAGVGVAGVPGGGGLLNSLFQTPRLQLQPGLFGGMV